MNIPTLELFQWLQQNSARARHVFAFSIIPGITYEKYQNLTGYSLPSNFDLNQNKDTGAQELKEILCSQYSCQPENVVTSTGGSEANFLVFLAMLRPGNEVIVEKPGYEPLYSTPTIFGARTINWERGFENHYQLDIGSLQDLITKKTKLIVVTNLHNPSGVLSSKQSLQQLAELAEERNIYVLVDEIFLDGGYNSPLSSFGLPQVIITSSMTKIYGVGGLRTGWIIAPEEIAKQCQHAKSHTTGCSPYISEILSSHLLRYAKEQLLDRYQSISKQNLSIVKKWMQKQHQFLDWIEPDGGVVCFLKYNSDIPSVTLCLQLMHTYGVLVVPGLYFNQEGYFRLCYGCKTHILKEGLKILGNSLEHIISL